MKILWIYLLIGITTCNIWDNVFSEMKASTPILISQSLSFVYPFEQEGVQMKGTFDFDKDAKVITIIVSKNLLLFDVELFKIEIDLEKFVVAVDRLIQCKRYRMQGISESGIPAFDLDENQDKIFLINIFFEWKGRHFKRGQPYEIYQFQPDIITPHVATHQKFEENPVLLINQDGRIFEIYQNLDLKQEQKIEFNNFSKIKTRMQCGQEIQDITLGDVKSQMKQLIREMQISQEQIKDLIPDIFK